MLSADFPELRAALQEVSRLERTILIFKAELLNLEEDKNRLEQTIFKLAVSTRPKEVKQNEPEKPDN